MRNLTPIFSIVLIILTIGCIADNKIASETTITTAETISTTITISSTTILTTTTHEQIITTSTTATINPATTTIISTTTIPTTSSTTTTAEKKTTTTTTSSTTLSTTTTSVTSTTLRTTTTTIPKTTTTTLKTPGNPDIVISAVQFDAPGDDRKKENLNGEWVEISNSGNSGVDLTGWTLNDNGNHVYNFPSGFRIKSGNSVKIHTGSGTDTEFDLYWNSSRAIWNNDGDTATVKDKEGVVVDKMNG